MVNGSLRNQVDVYETATMTLLKRFPVFATPSHMAFSPDSRVVFISLQGSDKLGGVRPDHDDARCGPSRSAQLRPACCG